nr:phosphatase PAP2 family protein [Rubellimicrobium aerolatum]
MLGDGAVLILVAALLVTLLALYREWRLAAVVAGAGLLGAVAVPLLKGLLHRARPLAMGDGAQAFSFPSGHSTLAAIVLGILALFVARAAPARFRTVTYGAFAALVALIALSRVYLQAHWPSDVMAGLLFGAAVVILVALMLRTQAVSVPGRAFAALLGVIVLVVAPLHLWRGYAAAYAGYDVPTPTVVLTQAQWLDGAWAALPQARILLDGDPGEPMVLQTDLPLAQVVEAARAAGWRPHGGGLAGELAAALLPSRGDLLDRAPWPMTHLGRAPLATLVRSDPEEPARRLVLRIWGTDRVVDAASASRSLLAASLTAETLDPLAFGWSLLETVDDARPAATDVTDVLPGLVTHVSGNPILVAAPGA